MIKTSSRILIIVERSAVPYYSGPQIWLGPLYIVSYLEERGITCDFLDRNVEPDKQIDFSVYNTVGFSVNINNIKRSVVVAQEIKRINPNIKMVFGGPFASIYPQALAEEEYVDAVIVGEGEETFYEYAVGRPKSSIKGLYYRENTAVTFTGYRPWIENLDALPFPALQKIKLKKYNNIFSKRVPLSYIITTRGCPYSCSFCYHNMGNKWRARSADNVVDEIEWQVKGLGAKEIGIVDDNFTFDRERVVQICEEIRRRHIKVSLQFTNGIRADSIDEEMMARLKDVGLWIINLAPESGSERTIEHLKKGFTIQDVENAVRIAKKYGIAIELYIMIGFPWETREDYKKTLQLPFELDVDFVTVNRYLPFPQTPLQSGEMSFSKIEKRFWENVCAETYHTDDVDKMRRSFLRKWYSDPRRIARGLRALNMFSPDKILRPDMLISVCGNAWSKLGKG